jgi:2-oxoacid:acceptor oxidoreductase gamma subunit (pyruvate/2-ketoisovalerate family)
LRCEIIFHGRGGQGAVTAAEIMAYAAILSGLYAQAFPEFGAERRGAPVKAYFRVDDKEPIYERNPVERPDMIAVLDEGLILRLHPPIYTNLKSNGWIIINSSRDPEKLRDVVERKDVKIAVVNATSIALELFKRPIVNTTIIGALMKVFNVIPMENIEKAIRSKFQKDVAEINIKAIKKGYENTVVIE